jgi:hypothetical protein
MGLVVFALGGPAGCRQDAATATGEDLIKLLDSDSPADRLQGSKELAAQGEGAIPRIMEAFSKAADKPHVQTALADAVFRMKVSDATIAALGRMAEQAKDPAAREEIAGLAKERKLRR